MLSLLPLAVAARASTVAASDWEIAVVTAGAAGASEVNALIEQDGVLRDPTQTLVLGGGFADLRRRISVFIADSFGAPAYRVTTTKALGGLHASYRAHAGPGAGKFSLSGGLLWPDGMAPRQQVAVLLFAGNGYFAEQPKVHLSSKQGSVGLQLIRGHGTAMWRISDRDQGIGGAVTAPSAAAQAGVNIATTRTAGAAIVGAYLYDARLGAARWSWTSPTGRGSGHQVATPTTTIFTGTGFDGPAGRWTLRWSGSLVGDSLGGQALAAWVPLGRYRSWFARQV
jgi:hypothetical protein